VVGGCARQRATGCVEARAAAEAAAAALQVLQLLHSNMQRLRLNRLLLLVLSW
jgi:hypothetical protein